MKEKNGGFLMEVHVLTNYLKIVSINVFNS